VADTLLQRLGDEFFRSIPSRPGVYLMLGQAGDLLYVGKAKNLRTRVRSYTRITDKDGGKLVRLAAAIRAVRWEECRDEAHALTRETELVRSLRPPYNYTHNASTEYLAIAIRWQASAVGLRLASDGALPGETMYGCYPFAAGTPYAYAALVRLLFRCQVDTPHGGISSKLTSGGGCALEVVDGLRPPLRDFLSGRSARLLPAAHALIVERSAGDPIAPRSAAKDVDVLRGFYELGPRGLRRLQEKHGVPTIAVDADRLADLLAAEYASQLGASSGLDRRGVEQRVAALRADGMGLHAITKRLNAEGWPRLRGVDRWGIQDVAEIVGALLARATRGPR
jgi:predicted GIY-YIG superfamily endonuclease